MAITKTILQNIRQQSVVKLNNDAGAGLSNITLLELKLADETFLGEANCNVNIQTVIWSASDSSVNPIIISRANATTSYGNVMYLHGSDSFELDQGAGFHDQQFNQANLSVFMPAYSTIYLVLGKSAGYQEPDQQTKK